MTDPGIRYFDKFPTYPIVGPTDSVIRFLRGETVWPHEIEADTSRSDVWVCNREQYERWRIISPKFHPGVGGGA